MEETKYVPIAVHREFEKRIDDENHRQNTRLSALEDAVREMTRLTVSVEKIAVSLENMTAEQKRISDRLTAIEEKPAKRWESIVGAIITGVVGILIGLISAGVIK